MSKGRAQTTGNPRFKPYTEYKDSGIEWLGEIPAQWKSVKVKRVCTFAYGESLAGNIRLDGDVEVYGSNGPVGSHERANTLAPCLVIGRKGSFGKVNFSPRPVFAIDTTFYVDPRFTHSNIRWLYYVLVNSQLDSYTKDSAIPGLDREDAYARDICTCPPKEQQAIATFLDRETAKIDALVAKKERLIELLQEKRAALITQAVTKGLNPNVPMKDSGMEWLAEIPAHWEVKRIRHVVKRIEQGWSPECENREADEDEWGVLKAGCVNRGSFVESEHKALPLPLVPIPELEIAEGDLLMSRASGSRDLVGSVAVVPKCRPRLLLCDKVFRLHVDRAAADRRFLAYAMNSRIARWQIEVVLSGGSGLANNIAQEVVKDLMLAQPTSEEQRAIASFLDCEVAKIDTLVAKIHAAIDRLKEQRTALISAAVTGKIDVRVEGT